MTFRRYDTLKKYDSSRLKQFGNGFGYIFFKYSKAFDLVGWVGGEVGVPALRQTYVTYLPIVCLSICHYPSIHPPIHPSNK